MELIAELDLLFLRIQINIISPYFLLLIKLIMAFRSCMILEIHKVIQLI